MELSDLAVTIGNYTFANPIMNAAGHAKNQEHFDDLLRSESSGIVIGSILPEEKVRMGHSGNVYYPGTKFGKPFSLNSLGIPCQSLSYYRINLPVWVKQAERVGKHLIFNIAGFKLDDYVKLARLAATCGVPILEVNFGCPNLSKDGVSKPTIAYDWDAMQSILTAVDVVLEDVEMDVWAKVSWDHSEQIKRNAELFRRYPMLKAVVTLNTLENCCDYDDKGRLVTTPNNGFAGMSGPAMRAPALGQIRKWRTAFDELNRPDLKIIGVGGSSTGEHIWQKRLAGADAYQVGTHYFDYCEAHPGSGEQVFSIMFREYMEAIERQTQIPI